MAGVIWYLLVFLADGALVVQLVAQLVDREVGPLEVVVALVLLLALNAFMLLHAADPIGPTIALLIVAFASMYRMLWRLSGQRQLAAIRARDMAEYQKLIEQRPDLPYPYEAVGDYLFERGMWEEAIAYYKQFLARQRDPEVLWKLRKAQEEWRREQQGLRQCPYCMSDVPRDAKTCPNCDHDLRGLVLDGLLAGTWKLEVICLAAITAVALAVAAVRMLRADPRLLALLPLVLLGGLLRVIFFHGPRGPARHL